MKAAGGVRLGGDDGFYADVTGTLDTVAEIGTMYLDHPGGWAPFGKGKKVFGVTLPVTPPFKSKLDFGKGSRPKSTSEGDAGEGKAAAEGAAEDAEAAEEKEEPEEQEEELYRVSNMQGVATEETEETTKETDEAEEETGETEEAGEEEAAEPTAEPTAEAEGHLEDIYGRVHETSTKRPEHVHKTSMKLPGHVAGVKGKWKAPSKAGAGGAKGKVEGAGIKDQLEEGARAAKGKLKEKFYALSMPEPVVLSKPLRLGPITLSGFGGGESGSGEEGGGEGGSEGGSGAPGPEFSITLSDTEPFKAFLKARVELKLDAIPRILDVEASASTAGELSIVGKYSGGDLRPLAIIPGVPQEVKDAVKIVADETSPLAVTLTASLGNADDDDDAVDATDGDGVGEGGEAEEVATEVVAAAAVEAAGAAGAAGSGGGGGDASLSASLSSRLSLDLRPWGLDAYDAAFLATGSVGGGKGFEGAFIATLEGVDPFGKGESEGDAGAAAAPEDSTTPPDASRLYLGRGTSEEGATHARKHTRRQRHAYDAEGASDESKGTSYDAEGKGASYDAFGRGLVLATLEREGEAVPPPRDLGDILAISPHLLGPASSSPSAISRRYLVREEVLSRLYLGKEEEEEEAGTRAYLSLSTKDDFEVAIAGRTVKVRGCSCA